MLRPCGRDTRARMAGFDLFDPQMVPKGVAVHMKTPFLENGRLDEVSFERTAKHSVDVGAAILVVGQRGTKAVFDRYPRLEGRPWERLESTFQRWGAFTLVLSGIPGLGAALLVVAGAVGIGRRVFLFWVFVGKVLRYWVLAFIVLFSLQLLG